ncbi:MAG: tRNA (guanosine(37)-N1)-methyltransferase TrmD [Chloroflexi bacterium]|nr:tRNA (guanosine(37)-N1)-methyltransferase TrmD [Chloroflexota bacterium]
MPLRIDVVTLFPEMFVGPFDASILRRARDEGRLDLRVHQLRQWARGRHQVVDDYPYGGGPGMVLMAEPICRAVEAVRGPTAVVVVLAASAPLFRQEHARAWAQASQLVLVCGHYEGIDERAIEVLGAQRVSIGDYVLTGGELAAMVVIDAVARLVPGVLGAEASSIEESYSAGVLEYPQYTRPVEFRGRRVPEVLVGGSHAAIAAWRRRAALARTLAWRPDLLDDPAWEECARLGLLPVRAPDG